MPPFRQLFHLSLSLVIVLSSAASPAFSKPAKSGKQMAPAAAFHTPMAGVLDTSVDTSQVSDWRNESARVPQQTYALEVSENVADAATTAEKNAAWSLPMEGPMGTINGGTKKKERRRFDASINLSEGRDAVVAKVDELMDAALARDPEAARLDKAVKHFNSKTQKVIAETKDGLDYVISYRGFGPSSEAADIVTGDKLKLKSRASAEFAKQKHIDELHYKVVCNVMQVAQGIGMTDKIKGAAATDSGMAALKELVGDEQAEQTYTALQNWSHHLNVPESIYEQGAWQVSDKETKLRTVMKSALDSDPLLQEVTRRLHKYNNRSKFARGAAHVVETSLGVAALTPSFVGPAAKTALVAFVMSTGGPEQCKILKTLYMDKRIESRAKALTEQAHLAIDNYQVAVLTRNPVLLACAESLVSEISGDGTVTTVFGSSVLPKNQVAAGPITQ